MRKASPAIQLSVLALVFCRVLLPILTILLLTVFSSMMPRQLLSGSLMIDWLVRSVLIVYFCVQYWYLPKLYYPTPGRWLWISDSVLRDPSLLRGYYVFTGVGYTLAAALLTYWAFPVFLPWFASWRIPAACLNALVFVLAFVLRYRSFKLLAAKQLG